MFLIGSLFFVVGVTCFFYILYRFLTCVEVGKLIVLVACCGAFSLDLRASENLPGMDHAPWTGYFSAYIRRGFEFGVDGDGKCEIFLKTKAGKRVGVSRTIKIYPEILVVLPDGKRKIKRLNKGCKMSTRQKPGKNHQKVNFIAETSDGVRIVFDIRYEGNEILLDGKIIDRGSLMKGQLFFVYRVLVPAMYSSTYKKTRDSKKVKSRMRKDRIRFVRAKDGRVVKLKSYIDVDLEDEKLAKSGVRQLEVRMDGQEGRRFYFSTENKKGVIYFENKTPHQKGKLWEGYSVRWQRESGDFEMSPLVIEVK